MKYPKVSILVPTINEEKNIGACLASIFQQDYPNSKLEVFVVDNESTDSTVEIAKKFPVKIMINKKVKDAQVSKRMAFDKATGELYMHFDADLRMVTKNWLKDMVRPMMEDSKIVGAFSGFVIKGDESPLTRFLTLDNYSPSGFSCQRTPMHKFFTISLPETIAEKRKNYSVCIFEKDRIPLPGLGLLRKKVVEKTIKFQGNKLMELDLIAHLVNMGYNKFAYVPVGLNHYTIPNIKILLSKRMRNIGRNYVGQKFKRAYSWFNFSDPKDLIKIFIWVVYANLIIPELIVGIIKSIKYKTWVGLYQPVVSFLETDVVVFGFLYFKLRERFGKLPPSPLDLLRKTK